MSDNKIRLIRIELSLICGLFALSLLLRLALVLPTNFDGLYGQDAYAYYDYAQNIRDTVQSGTPLKPFFWPLGYPTLLAITFSSSGTNPSIAQAVSLLMGAALTSLVYIIARQIGVGHFGSIAAAAIMTFCGQALQSSTVVMSDIPALFWATVSLMFLLRYLTPSAPLHTYESDYKTRWLILAAVNLVLASLTRWIYLVLGLPFALAVVLSWHGRIRWRATLLTLVVIALILLPQILYSRTNPFPALNHEWVEGWSPANALQRSFTNPDGRFDYEKINAVYYAQPYYDPNYLSPLFSIFIIIGLWTLARQKLWLLILLGSWILLPYLFLAGIPYQNIRFPLIVVPAVALLIGRGFDAVINWLRTTRVKQFRLIYLQGFIVIILLLGLWQMWGNANTLVTTFINNQQRDKLAAAWVGENVPAGSTVYTFGLTLTLQHYTAFKVYELYYETPQTLAGKWQRGKDEYLVLNLWNIENQWVGRDPQLDYHWLRDQRGLEQLGKFGNYTLFKIRG
ncbi:MAG: phospholipid carrier-dependent glycosyltransferase [Anaerolineaceae bacterium]|nr:phospholipid carrier-dependent glycosyltransferase [Anaerolineaceae bacterium]